jgi:hypothetical protein
MSVLPAHKIITATTVSELETKLASATAEGYIAQSIATDDDGNLVTIMLLTPPDILWRRNNPTVLE